MLLCERASVSSAFCVSRSSTLSFPYKRAACERLRSRPLEISFYWVTVFRGGGKIIMYTETEGGEEWGGDREAGGGWGTVSVCVLCRRVCVAERKIVSGRGFHGERLWFAKPVLSVRLWERDKTVFFYFFHHLSPFFPFSSTRIIHLHFHSAPLSLQLGCTFSVSFLLWNNRACGLWPALQSSTWLPCRLKPDKHKAGPISYPVLIPRLKRRWPTLGGGL